MDRNTTQTREQVSGSDHSLEGPTHAGDLHVEWRGLESVPENLRYGTPRRLGTLWFAANLTPVALFIGVIGVTIGLNFWQNALAIGIGGALGSIPVALISVTGMRSGYPQMALARLPFGKLVTLIGIAVYAESVVFLAIAAIFGVEALQVLFHISLVPALIIVFGMEAIVSVIGYELLHMFEMVASVLAGVGYLVLTVAVISKAGSIHIHQTAHGSAGAGAFLLMTVIAFSYTFGWSPYASDYCRYLPSNTSRTSLIWWVFGGLAVSTIWLELLGLAAGAILPNRSPMAAVYSLVGAGPVGVVVMVAIILGVVAYMAATDYSGGLQILSAGLRVPRPYITVASSLLAGTVTWWLSSGGLAGKAENLILLSTYWVAPWIAVVLIDWSGRKTKDSLRIAQYVDLPSGWAAATAVVVGYVACLPFSDTTTGNQLAAHGGFLAGLFGSVSRGPLAYGDLAFVVGFVVGFGLYLLLTKVAKVSTGDAAATATLSAAVQAD